MSEVAQEESHSDHCVATAVQGRIYDSSVAFASDEGVHAMHLGGDVHFSYRSRVVATAVLFGDVPECPGGGEVGYCVKLLSAIGDFIFKQVVRHADKRIFLYERLSVFAYKCQSVHIRIYGYAQIRLAFDDGAGKFFEVLRQRLRVVGEVAGRLAVESHAFHAQSFEQTRHYYASN